MGGKISVSSHIGMGSCFKFKLPLKNEEGRTSKLIFREKEEFVFREIVEADN